MKIKMQFKKQERFLVMLVLVSKVLKEVKQKK